MTPFLQNIINSTISVVLALGIVDGFKKLVLFRFDEWIEKRKFGREEKRDAREALLNFISSGQATSFMHYPKIEDVAHIKKMENKIQAFDKPFAINIDAFLAAWVIYAFMVKENLPADQREEYSDRLTSLVDNMVSRINMVSSQ